MSPHPSTPSSSRDVPDDTVDTPVAFIKGPKRKRLAKACDACHKSKRRCDGTAPCGNCYYASKQCTYTDSAGRPVPAPRERVEPLPNSERPSAGYPELRHPPTSSVSTRPEENGDKDPISRLGRKRPRSDEISLHPDAYPSSRSLPPVTNRTLAADRPVELDHTLVRELVNLFFTHSHPYRMFIHQPTFFAALTKGHLPRYLLFAVCAMAAPVCKQHRIRTSPSRIAGSYFAQEAVSLLFDQVGRLQQIPSLSVIQTLCLLWLHDFRIKSNTFQYHDLALQLLRSLGVYASDEEISKSQAMIKDPLERECMRRIFWHIHCTNVRNAIYFRQPLSFNIKELNEIRIPLPVDETSFDLSDGAFPTPEFLQMQPPRFPSEYGLYVRILTIYSNIEHVLHPFSGKDSIPHPAAMLQQAEDDVKAWTAALPDNMRFSDETLEVQLSMFETNANTGAWCYFAMHIYHASCALAINFAREFHTRGPKHDPIWAVAQLDKIANILGYRARNSFLLGAIIWSLKRYSTHHVPQMRQWSLEVEDFWGVDMCDLAAKAPAPPLALNLAPHTQSIYDNASSFYQPAYKTGHINGVTEIQTPSTHPLPQPTEISVLSTPPMSVQRQQPQNHYHMPIDSNSYLREERRFSNPELDPTITVPSLPSLKSSGLLDWNSDATHVRQGSSPTRGYPPGAPPDLDPSRTSFGMPVGLQWLANESR